MIFQMVLPYDFPDGRACIPPGRIERDIPISLSLDSVAN